MLDIVLAVVAIVSASLIGFLILSLHRVNYWKRRGIPGPPPLPIFGNTLSWRGSNIVLCLREWTAKYGRVYGIKDGPANVLVTSDLAMLHELFVEKFDHFHARKNPPIAGNVDLEAVVTVFQARGARWKRLRALANPAFSTANLRKVLPTVKDSCRTCLDLIGSKGVASGRPFNIHPFFQELTMDVVSRVAMGQQGSHQFQNEYLSLAQRVFLEFGTTKLYLACTIFPKLVFLIRWFAKTTGLLARHPIMALRAKLIVEVARRKSVRDELISKGEPMPESRDFIDFFLDSESSEAQENTKSVGLQTFDRTHHRVSRELTADEVVGMCQVFLLAGFDTTANALAITCYYLAKWPEVQEQLYDEIMEICGDDYGDEGDGEDAEGINLDQINRLKYAEACMKESLRLTPIAAIAASRLCTQTTTLGKYTIEAGTFVEADVYSVHMDKEVWGDDVADFRPERMLEEERRPLLAWIPFGAGPRTCVGMRLAILEEKCMLVYLLRKYRLVACAETEAELELRGGAVLSPKSVTVKLEPRST